MKIKQICYICLEEKEVEYDWVCKQCKGETMKITAISDTHGRHERLKLDSGDILIHAGDIEATTQNSLINFCKWFESQPFKYKVFIGGNHDFYLQEHPIRSEEVIENFDIVYLNDEELGLPYKDNYLRIYGTPWSLPFYDWAFMKSQEDLMETYSIIPDNIDIIITHAPPFGSRRGIVKSGEDVGVKGLPRVPYTICGHIHEGYGSTYDAYHNTYVYNASVLNEKYELVNEPISFEI